MFAFTLIYLHIYLFHLARFRKWALLLLFQLEHALWSPGCVEEELPPLTPHLPPAGDTILCAISANLFKVPETVLRVTTPSQRRQAEQMEPLFSDHW